MGHSDGVACRANFTGYASGELFAAVSNCVLACMQSWEAVVHAECVYLFMSERARRPRRNATALRPHGAHDMRMDRGL